MSVLTPSLSHVKGATNVPLLRDTIGDYFDSIVRKHAQREALVVRHKGIRWTYQELQQRVNALAAASLRLGLQTGDRLGIWSPNNSEWVLTQLATAKVGLILVNINPANQLGELQYA